MKKNDTRKGANKVPFLKFAEDEVEYTNSLGPNDVIALLPPVLQQDEIYCDKILSKEFWGEGFATVDSIREAFDAGLFKGLTESPSEGGGSSIIIADGFPIYGLAITERVFSSPILNNDVCPRIPVIVSSDEPFTEEDDFDEDAAIEDDVIEADIRDGEEFTMEELAETAESEDAEEEDSVEDAAMENDAIEVDILHKEESVIEEMVEMDEMVALEKEKPWPIYEMGKYISDVETEEGLEDIRRLVGAPKSKVPKLKEPLTGHDLRFTYEDGRIFEPPAKIKYIVAGRHGMWRMGTIDGRRFIIPGNFLTIEQLDDKPWIL